MAMDSFIGQLKMQD